MLARGALALGGLARGRAAAARRGLCASPESAAQRHARADAASAERLERLSARGTLRRFRDPLVNTFLAAVAFATAARSYKAVEDKEIAQAEAAELQAQMDAFKGALRSREWAERTSSRMASGESAADVLHYEIRHLIGDSVAVTVAKPTVGVGGSVGIM